MRCKNLLFFLCIFILLSSAVLAGSKKDSEQSFSHDTLDKSILNNCVSCHSGPDDSLHGKFKKECVSCHGTESWLPARFEHAESITNGTSCRDCHVPPEDAVHISSNLECGRCHETKTWRPATFEHDRYFSLDNEHKTNCKKCHPKGDFSSYTCYGCHEHSPGKLAREHREEGLRDFNNCADCHRSGDEHELDRVQGLKHEQRGGNKDHEKHERGHKKKHRCEHGEDH